MFLSTKLAIQIWYTTSLVFGVGFTLFIMYNNEYTMAALGLVGAIAAAVGSLPALLLLIFLLPFVAKSKVDYPNKWWLLLLLLLMVCLPYGIVAAIINGLTTSRSSLDDAFELGFGCTGILFASCAVSAIILHNKIGAWLLSSDRQRLPANTSAIESPALENAGTKKTSGVENQSLHNQQIQTTMNTEHSLENETENMTNDNQSVNSYNKNLIKATITAGLILAMLIPAKFITGLVEEREQRQKQVTAEVSSKWAQPQTLSTPYLCIPYKQLTTNDTGKQIITRTMVFETADMLNVKADIQPEMRRRSIYNVLLYKSNINLNGNIILKTGKDVIPENLILSEAKLCVGISDFKGIEEKVTVNFNDTTYELEPGLPDNAIDKQGLSAPVSITQDIFTKGATFSLNIKLKGSEQLHFLPLANNSDFQISSSWPNPSFDGSSLPKEREVTDSGFVAKWSFNKANMPVLSQLFNTDTDKENMAFGVSMIEPADQYAKTNRSVKYAILFVGLTFAMFFIIELMQKKNIHPVQYILVGLALIIFYTLLLSIGEFTGFNVAYAIAAFATISLIGIYAKTLFSSLKTSIVLSAFIGMLYGFIYILIQLEDTALLAGSIGLFVLLAVAMYFSKRINWYAGSTPQNILTT